METVDSFIETMEILIDELVSKANQLPNVDKNGYSECPFAEDLYADKEKAVDDVERALTKLMQYIDPVKGEVDRCRHNLKQINADSKMLRTDPAKKDYDFAKKIQASEYNQAIERRKKLFELIQRAVEELHKAKEKQQPLGKPEAQRNFNSAAVSGPRGSGFQSIDLSSSRASKPSFNKEMSNLLSIGPLGK